MNLRQQASPASVEKAINEVLDGLRPALNAQGSDVYLISVSRFGMINVELSGKCCVSTHSRVKTMLMVEDKIKENVPGIRIVTANFKLL
ncbi:MAG: NifU family protein [Desulfuromusa sp.]|nr:NifU family protein [Desulfuromusa sp.]